MLLFPSEIRTLDDLVLWEGYVLLFAVVLAATGLFAGFFLPGDSFLIATGLIAVSGSLDIVTAVLTLVAATVLGDTTGYLTGRGLKKTLLSRKESWFFHRDHLYPHPVIMAGIILIVFSAVRWLKSAMHF